ncbi:serine/threonine protein kinase [Streptomyces actinomycinicus]|uniref:Serine/threonine protein kinase n=1 Tax=Streptomyces actinomycinicus TaxID=1695166 RepID=A0A937ES56_9ACTN|nr:serine/threonine-protein kinase [Streptomyces actinomycinicus]MBL1086969.1 serine/threonine protein kinase [Streptomyces actinomycinicus]
MKPLDATDPAAVGGYPVLARLGAGGMGQVYLSRTTSGRPLALKTVRPDLAEAPDFEARFAREVRNSDLVRSPFTVSVIDYSPPGHRPQWLATEYVAAPSLADWVVAHGPLPAVTARALAGELAAALAAVHDCSLAHRDVKPSNVLLARERPMLIDFGIARAADDSRHTQSGGVIGSPGYLAPEQVSRGIVTEAGDVFSLGCVLVFAATGRSPFQHPEEEVSAASLLYRIVHEQAHTGALPPELLPVVMRCLAKLPEERPTSKELTELLPRRSGPSWKQSLPPGLDVELAAREAEVSRLVPAPVATTAPPPPIRATAPPPVPGTVPPIPATAPPPVPGTVPPRPAELHPIGAFGPPPSRDARTLDGGGAPPGTTGTGRPTARASRGWWTAAAAAAVAVVSLVAWWQPFLGRDDHPDPDRKGGGHPSPSTSETVRALPQKWAGVWTGTGPGNPRADGQLAPRTTSFKVTLTLHTASVGELAGKQVSNVTEAGTGREVGCTEALELRGVRGATATLEAVTSHPTDRSASLLSCEKGHVYVVELSADDTISLGEEGAQSAGAPSRLHRGRDTG